MRIVHSVVCQVFCWWWWLILFADCDICKLKTWVTNKTDIWEIDILLATELTYLLEKCKKKQLKIVGVPMHDQSERRAHINCCRCCENAASWIIAKYPYLAKNKRRDRFVDANSALHLLWFGMKYAVCVFVRCSLSYFIHVNPQYTYSLLVFHVILVYIVALT